MGKEYLEVIGLDHFTWSPPVFDDEAGALFEKRAVSIRKGRLIDACGPYGVHIYGPWGYICLGESMTDMGCFR